LGMDTVSFINVGSGEEITIRQLADTIGRTVGFGGEMVWDTAKPDGMMRKIMDTSRLRQTGWAPQIDLKTGIRNTCQDYRDKSMAGTQ